MKVKDLRNQTGMDRGDPKKHYLLFCQWCCGEYSANAGDYFLAAPDTVLECCDHPLLLVDKQTTHKVVEVP